MFAEIKKYAKIMYEKDFIYGLNGSISSRFEDNAFLINKNTIFNDDNSFFIKLLLNENYKQYDACKYVKLHSKIYNSFSQAKVIAVVCTKDIMKICDGSSLKYQNQNIFIENELILQDMNVLIDKLRKNKSNFLMIKNFGLLIFDRDFNGLFSKIFDIDLQAKISL
ncbi:MULTISPECIES: hypothetical protein [unclassified Campylobacter]|uniref:hypothetical protein n=1 Tax=unclassified Campylobacter TaxID=2593542 RepID=UPI001D68D0EA|nr:hypothetical protein [Campylobacter sp. RM12637]MBZ7992129.1 hypothetical protein [Campylobacter sp. RM9333]